MGERGELTYEFRICYSDFRAEVPSRSGLFGPGGGASDWSPHAEHRPTDETRRDEKRREDKRREEKGEEEKRREEKRREETIRAEKRRD